MMLGEITQFGSGMMVASYVATLSAFAWMIVTQIKTNNSFRDAINEFRITIQLMNLNYTNQQTACKMHREQTEANRKKLEVIQLELTRLKTQSDDQKNNSKVAGRNTSRLAKG